MDITGQKPGAFFNPKRAIVSTGRFFFKQNISRGGDMTGESSDFVPPEKSPKKKLADRFSSLGQGRNEPC